MLSLCFPSRLGFKQDGNLAPARRCLRHSRLFARAARSVLFAYAATLALSALPKGRAMRCTVLGFTSNLAAVLRTLMAPARAVLIRSANLSAIGGRRQSPK